MKTKILFSLERPAIFIAMIAAFLVVSCASAESEDSDSDGAAYKNRIFHSASWLDASVDAGSLSGGQPSFSWPATGRKHVVTAVFDDHISVHSDIIQNPERIVWIWNSGLRTGREGNVTFPDGVSDVYTKADPVPLAPGDYYFAVWAFNDEGIPIISSTEIPFNIP